MHLIQQIGSYAGLASIPALCLLSALCFSQARDVRRLREWAGRAPERAAEAARSSQGVVQSAPLAAPQPPVSGGTGAQPAIAGGAPKPPVSDDQTTVARPLAGAHERQPPLAAPAALSSQPLTQAARAASAVAPARAVTAERPPPVAPPLRRPVPAPPLPGIPSARRFGRPAARTLGLVAVIVVALVAAAALAITQLNGSSSPHTSTQAVGAQQPGPAAPPPVRVAVLNGTTVPGLGKKVGARVRASGLMLGKVGNTAGKQHATSQVLYAPGKQDTAQMVGGKLGITGVAPSDAATEAAAKGAPVIVIVGADGGGSR